MVSNDGTQPGELSGRAMGSSVAGGRGQSVSSVWNHSHVSCVPGTISPSQMSWGWGCTESHCVEALLLGVRAKQGLAALSQEAQGWGFEDGVGFGLGPGRE